MLSVAHKFGGATALAMIILFRGSTLLSEPAFNAEMAATVKTAMPYGFLILVPALAVAGASGLRAGISARHQDQAQADAIIAANDLLVLMPAAFFLTSKAQEGRFGTTFCTRCSQYRPAGAQHP